MIRRAKPAAPPQKYRKLRDGEGLYVFVTPQGKKLWRFDYQHAGRARTLSLGIYPTVSLAEARERKRQARIDVAAGRDPSALRQRARKHAVAAAGHTFAALAGEWLELQDDRYAASTTKKIRWLLDTFLLPALGAYPIVEIEPPMILAALKAIEKTGRRDTTHRAKQLCGQIFRFAIATGRATRDQSADLKGALKAVRTRHHAAIVAPAKVGALLRAIDGYDGTPSVRAALQLLARLFVRPGELRRMEWAEVDRPARLWRIPEQKTKMRREHLVPLSRQALRILTAARPLSRGSRYVFPSLRTIQQPLSDMTLSAALRRLGYTNAQMTAHGFRAMARTLLDEQLRYPPDVIEAQLAHATRGALGDTYNRAKWIEERTAMMQAYADYLETLKNQTAGN